MANNGAVNDMAALQEQVMDVTAPVHSIGENVMLSKVVHEQRSSVDELDDKLAEEEEEAVDAIYAIATDIRIRELCEEFKEARAKRKKCEFIDDSLHEKSHAYTQTISGLYDKALLLLTGACKGYEVIRIRLNRFFKSNAV